MTRQQEVQVVAAMPTTSRQLRSNPHPVPMRDLETETDPETGTHISNTPPIEGVRLYHTN